MNRLHVHIAVQDLAESVRYYTALFGEEPSVRKEDYAKWLLDDPRVNFAISARGRPPGLNHLGIQVETPAQLAAITQRLRSVEIPLHEENDAHCCYARSDKTWSTDPAGIRWESFYSRGTHAGSGRDTASANQQAACCGTAGSECG